MNTGLKIVCAVLLVAVVTAAGVGLLVQHRELDKQKRARENLESVNEQLVANHGELASANDKLANELRALRDAGRVRAAGGAAAEKGRTAWKNAGQEPPVGHAWAGKETLAALSNRLEKALVEAMDARVAQARAEKEAVGLQARVRDLTAANERVSNELNVLRDADRARTAELAAAEKERTAWKAEQESLAGRAGAREETLAALSNRLERALVESMDARAAQARAEKEAAGLQARVRDLTAANKEIRAEREKFRAERDRLERELNEAMQPAQEEEAPAPVSVPDSGQTAIPITFAPMLDKRTPEERIAHEKEELNDLLAL